MDKKLFLDEIKKISLEDTDIKSKRNKLDLLIDSFKKNIGYIDPASYPTDKVAGAWKQVFTDQQYPIPKFLMMEDDAIYQIVSKENHYWNVSNINVFGVLPTVGCLRGKYKLNTDSPSVDVEFTRNGFRFSHLPDLVSATEYSQTLENGKRWIISLGKGQAPTGPIGIRGKLTSIYVDDNIRIDAGEQYDYLDDKGNVLVKGFSGTLFILEKVATF